MISTLLLIVALFSSCQCKVEFSDRARNFSISLLYFTAEETKWHTVISPFGVWTLLTGISTGASGSTREQLLRTLILPTNEQKLITGYKTLSQSVLRTQTQAVQMKIRNYVFADSTILVKNDFVQKLRKNFGAIFTKINFKPSNIAAQVANDVIFSHGPPVSEVYKSSDFDNSKMIITNAISIKAFWKTPFNVSNTREAPFYDEMGNKVRDVNMMNHEGNPLFSRINKMEAHVLELPYGDEETTKYSLLIFLPFPNVTVSRVYEHLADVSFNDIFQKLTADAKKYGLTQVIISVPRFKISTNVVLNRPLVKMGMEDLFYSDTANFDKITDADGIFVSAIVHKAEIEVTETGTVASAFTSAYFEDRSRPAVFNANKPFIYFILEKTTNTIVFSGFYSEPSKF